ncbi:type IV pilus assembly protein PilX [Oxalobacteraceae bacterium GrIS 1.11]
MMPLAPPRRHATRQGGAVLMLALFLMVAILLLGASAAQLALQGEKAARGERDWHIAFQAAEEALMDAEHDIEGRAGAPGRSAMFAPDSALGFVDGCGSDSVNLGLCLRAGEGAPPVWQSIDFADDGAGTARSVPYGRFTGAAMQTGEGFLPFKRPRYIIELLPYTKEGEDAGAGMRYIYRVTAIGFGARESSQVVLQTFYRKPAGSSK